MEQAIADLNVQITALQDAVSRIKPSPPAQDFTPEVQAATASITAAVAQINAAFPPAA